MSSAIDTVSMAVPHLARLHLGRAAVQTLADHVGVQVLHIKGDTVDPSIRPKSAPGTDIDIMVHPQQLTVFDAALRASGWRVYSTFTAGSPFGHAQTYLHPTWGYLDLHRCFPGIGLAAEPAFDRLWSMHRVIDVSGVHCAVPSLPAQAVIMILNAARAHRPAELDVAWGRASPEFRLEIENEVAALRAELVFDAAFGRLDAHRRARDYRLWKAITEGGGRIEEWWGRVLAAPTPTARIGLVLRAPLVNRAHLEHQLGRPPTRSDVIYEFIHRPVRGIRELLRRRS